MTSRRQVLAGLAAATAAPLAGCSPCGETWAARQLAFDVESVERTTAGEWTLTVTATADFDFPKSEDAGFGAFDVALYGADKSLLDYDTVDGLQWSDVPETERTETDCGDYGSQSVTRSFTVGERPHYVGPRFVEGHEASSLDPNSSQGFSELTAVRYAPGAGGGTATEEASPSPPTPGGAETGTSDRTATTTTPTVGGNVTSTATTTESAPPTVDDNATATTDGNATATSPTTDGNTTATTTDDATPGTDAGGGAPSDYEQVTVETLPWPEPDNQAVTETERLTNVRFRTSPTCTSRGGARVDALPFDSDVLAEWARRIPGGSCKRPYLEAASFAAGRLTLRVGLHEAPQVRCRDCEYIRYRLVADWRGGDRPVEEGEFVHVSESGEVEERIVETVDE